MHPTLHYKMKADEAYDGFCDGLQTRCEHRDADIDTETRRDH